MKTIGQIFEETQAKYLIVSFEESKYWNENITNRCNGIKGVYLFLNEPTNCCSINVDYPCIQLYNSFDIKEGFEEDEDLLEAEVSNVNIYDQYSYYGEKTIPLEYHVVMGEFGNQEEVEDYYKSNHVL